jgi:hypothetical protein
VSAPVVAEQRAPFSEQGETKKQRIPRSVVTGVALIGFASPAAAYLWFIHQYGVNVPIGDQWVNITLIGHSGEHRSGFQRGDLGRIRVGPPAREHHRHAVAPSHLVRDQFGLL